MKLSVLNYYKVPGYVSEIHIITDLYMGQGIQELTK